MFSIVIPFKGRADLVIQTLESVRNQTYNGWECILVDDGTEQNELFKITSHAGIDPRIRIIPGNADRRGGNVCRNIGWRNARYSLIIFLDSDDLFAIDALERRAGVIGSNDGYDFWVFPSRIFYDRPGDTTLLWNEIRAGGVPDEVERFLCMDMPWHTTGPVYSKSFLEQIGGWNESLASWQDWEMAIRSIAVARSYFKALNYNPDHYFRKNKYGAVSGKVKSYGYLQGTMRAIVAGEPYLLKAGVQKSRIKQFLHWYFFSLAIQRHSDAHYLRLLLEYPFFKSITVFEFAGLWVGKKLSVRSFGRRMLGPKKLAKINPAFGFTSSYQIIELPFTT